MMLSANGKNWLFWNDGTVSIVTDEFLNQRLIGLRRPPTPPRMPRQGACRRHRYEGAKRCMRCGTWKRRI